MTAEEKLREIQLQAAEKERKGIEAQKLLDQITPYLERMEKAAIDTAVSQQWQHGEGEANTKRLLERVSVIRALKVEIAREIDAGKAAVHHLEQVQRKAIA